MCKIKSITGQPLREYCETDFNVNAIRYAADNKQVGEVFRFTGTAKTGYNETSEEGKGIEFSVTYKDNTRISVTRTDTGKEYAVLYGEKAPSKPRPVKPTATPTTSDSASVIEEATTTDTATTQDHTTELNNVVSDFAAKIGALINSANTTPAPAPIDREAITQIVRDEIEKGVTHKIQINEGEPVAVEGLVHKSFESAIMWVKNGEPLYLHGPAGTGKNVLAEQIAKALNLPFYYAGALQQKYELEGFVDAGGEYQQTDFYKAFTGGGVFLFDEIDGTAAEVLVPFNAMLANGYYNFPKFGKVTAHPDFHVIAAGNTTGHGADSTYNGRFQLDASTTDRFAFVATDYDERIELHTANGDEKLVDFIHAMRTLISKQGLTYTASPRAIKRIIIAVQSGRNLVDALNMGLCGSWAKEDIKLLQRNIASEIFANKYADAFCEIKC